MQRDSQQRAYECRECPIGFNKSASASMCWYAAGQRQMLMSICKSLAGTWNMRLTSIAKKALSAVVVVPPIA